MRLTIGIVFAWYTLCMGEYDPNLGIGDKPPAKSCDSQSWQQFTVVATSVPEPGGGPNGSICNTTEGVGYVQVIEWICIEKFCCDPPCDDCSSPNVHKTICIPTEPGSEVVTVVCLDHRLYVRQYKKICCDGFIEDKNNICTENVTSPLARVHTPMTTAAPSAFQITQQNKLTTLTPKTDTNITIIETDGSPLSKPESRSNTLLITILAVLLGLGLLVIICLLSAFFCYRRKKKQEFEKVVFRTDAYDNNSYATPLEASGHQQVFTLPNADIKIKSLQEKGPLPLEVDIGVNPLYEKIKKENMHDYEELPSYDNDRKSGVSQYLSSSPYVSGLPSSNGGDEKDCDNDVNCDNDDLPTKHPLDQDESFENNLNDQKEATVFTEIKY